MKVLVSITAVLVVLGAIEALDTSQELFQEFIRKYDRHYSSLAEHRMRYLAFTKNLNKARQMQEMERGTAVYGMNKYSDFTEVELRQLSGSAVPKNHRKFLNSSSWPTSAPESFDWRDHHAVTRVKNQHSCNNDWAFSAVANIEGQYAIKHGKLVSLSEQEINDCDNFDGHCHHGGSTISAFDALLNLGGIESESDYPYAGKNTECKWDVDKVVAKVTGYEELPQDETKLAAWLAQNGPVSAIVNGTALQSYVSGIINHKWCTGSGDVIQAVALVGYGTENKHDYWIIKNSWGTDWGEQGYVRVARGVGMCGVSENPTTSVVA